MQDEARARGRWLMWFVSTSDLEHAGKAAAGIGLAGPFARQGRYQPAPRRAAGCSQAPPHTQDYCRNLECAGRTVPLLHNG